MVHFSQSKSFQTLRSLSQDPLDLTLPGMVNERRIQQMVLKKGDFKLLYATERVTEKVLEGFDGLSQEMQCLKKMKAMQSGEVVNFIAGYPSENRAALHTAMRDFFDPLSSSPAAVSARASAYEEFVKLEEFMKDLDKQGKFSELLHIGIGGSDLGPRAISYALEPFFKKGRSVAFISNVDPDEATSVLRKADLARTLVISVSKSGTTLETLVNEERVREAFRKAGLDPKNHIVAVTQKNSPMDDPTRYLACFYFWEYIGGRYSSTSMVGGVTLSFLLGTEVFKDFLQGAHEMDQTACESDLFQNLPLFSALLTIWNRNFLGCPTVAVVPYSQGLWRFPAHLQQCEMESNGKRIDKEGRVVDFKTGPVLWGEAGTNGQHSFYQLLHQGTDVIPMEFIGFQQCQYQEDQRIQGTTSQEKLLSHLFAQSLALAIGKVDTNPNKHFPGNRPNHILLGKKLDPYAMGALLAYYEHKVVFEGFIWNINSFDQEGVQLGKTMAEQVLTLFKAQNEGGKKSSFALGQAYLDHLK